MMKLLNEKQIVNVSGGYVCGCNKNQILFNIDSTLFDCPYICCKSVGAPQ